jgi:predicted RNase H-like HicB family nuclease
MDYYARLEWSEDGTCALECPYFKACYSSGDTPEEALENLKDVIQMCLAEIETEGAEPVLGPRFKEIQLKDAHNIVIKIVEDC